MSDAYMPLPVADVYSNGILKSGSILQGFLSSREIQDCINRNLALARCFFGVMFVQLHFDFLFFFNFWQYKMVSHGGPTWRSAILPCHGRSKNRSFRARILHLQNNSFQNSANLTVLYNFEALSRLSRTSKLLDPSTTIKLTWFIKSPR